MELPPLTTSKASAHYKGTRHCRRAGKDVEVRFTTAYAGHTFVHLLTTAQAEQLRLDIERALERNAHTTFK
jgi:hypothetical protein